MIGGSKVDRHTASIGRLCPCPIQSHFGVDRRICVGLWTYFAVGILDLLIPFFMERERRCCTESRGCVVRGCSSRSLLSRTERLNGSASHWCGSELIHTFGVSFCLSLFSSATVFGLFFSHQSTDCFFTRSGPFVGHFTTFIWENINYSTPNPYFGKSVLWKVLLGKPHFIDFRKNPDIKINFAGELSSPISFRGQCII